MSRLAIQRARIGIYRGRALQHVTPAQLARFFTAEDQGWSIREEVRRLVRFEQINLLEAFPPYLNKLDAIVCQNVTIYFQDATRKHLIEQFYQRLQDGGLLLLGFSEALWNISTPVSYTHLDVYKRQTYDLVVSDVEMPRLNGFQLTERIRQELKLLDLPVIIITSLASEEHRRQGLEAGAQAYIVKSQFNQSNLIDTIRQLLGK